MLVLRDLHEELRPFRASNKALAKHGDKFITYRYHSETHEQQAIVGWVRINMLFHYLSARYTGH